MKYLMLLIALFAISCSNKEEKAVDAGQVDADKQEASAPVIKAPVIVNVVYPNEKYAQEYIKSCMPICIHPKRPDLASDCECFCNEKGQNIREYKVQFKSSREMQKANSVNEFELTSEQVMKCFR